MKFRSSPPPQTAAAPQLHHPFCQPAAEDLFHYSGHGILTHCPLFSHNLALPWKQGDRSRLSARPTTPRTPRSALPRGTLCSPAELYPCPRQAADGAPLHRGAITTTTRSRAPTTWALRRSPRAALQAARLARSLPVCCHSPTPPGGLGRKGGAATHGRKGPAAESE